MLRGLELQAQAKRRALLDKAWQTGIIDVNGRAGISAMAQVVSEMKTTTTDELERMKDEIDEYQRANPL